MPRLRHAGSAARNSRCRILFRLIRSALFCIRKTKVIQQIIKGHCQGINFRTYITGFPSYDFRSTKKTIFPQIASRSFGFIYSDSFQAAQFIVSEFIDKYISRVDRIAYDLHLTAADQCITDVRPCFEHRFFIHRVIPEPAFKRFRQFHSNQYIAARCILRICNLVILIGHNMGISLQLCENSQPVLDFPEAFPHSTSIRYKDRSQCRPDEMSVL